MDLFSVVHTLIELIRAIDAYSTFPKNLAESLKTLKDELTSTRGLLLQLEEFVKEESGDTTTSPSTITLINPSQSSLTMQLINNQGQLQVLQETLKNITAWLDALGSKSKFTTLLSILRVRSQDDLKKVNGFLGQLERCKSTANLVLSMAIRYEIKSIEQ